MSELPQGWVQTTIGSICHLVNGKAFKPSDWSETGLPIVRIQNLNRADAKFNRYDGPVDGRFLIEDGDLLFAWSGTPGTSFGAHIWNGPTAVLNQHIFNVRFDRNALDRAFFRYAINQTLDEQIAKAHGGVGLRHVTKGKFEETTIALPPLPEQRRIVAKIDGLTGKSKRTRDHLDHIPRLVEKYKQAVLAAAFRGDLTREWRAQNRTDHVSPDELDELRKAAWTSPSVRSRYKEPDEIYWRPDIELPSGWQWASVDQLSCLVQYGSSAKADENDTGIAVLRMGNLQAGELLLTSLKYLPRDHSEFPDLLLRSGDVLFNRTNSAELVGKSAVYEGKPAKASFVSYLIRVRTCGIKPRLLSAYINSAYGREWVASVVNQQVGQANVNGTKLRQLGVPVMPVAEQEQLAQRIETAFNWIDRLASEATSARKLIDRLDQTVLAKAFRGELVPQDPSDEPASVLLERIRGGTRHSTEGKAR